MRITLFGITATERPSWSRRDFCRTLARANMDEKAKRHRPRETETMEADVSTAHSQDSAEAPHSMGRVPMKSAN